VTTSTLARIAILQLFGRRYVASNKNSRFQVIGYEARPLLRLTPPPEASGRVQTFNFIEAVTKLPASFTPAEISDLMKRVSPKLHGSLRDLFVVISDDNVPRNLGKGKQAASDAESEAGSKSKSSKRVADSPGEGPSAKK
jgi:hypothetical protein